MTLLLLACGVGPSSPPAGGRDSGSTSPTTRDAPPQVTPAGPLDCHAYDRDRDGVDLCDDCDDTDPSTFPAAPAVCFDGRNNSCGVYDEVPCAFEGLYELGAVGASVDGSASVASIEDLWGRVAFLDSDLALPAPAHTGDIDLQRPYEVTPDFPGEGYEAAGDVTGNGTEDLFFASTKELDLRLVRTDPADPAGDIAFQPSAAYFAGSSGDADGDGIPDVTLQDVVSGDVYIYTQVQPGASYAMEDATATFMHNVSAGYSYGTFSAAKDLDGDGLVEVVSEWMQAWDSPSQVGLIGVFLSPVQGTRVRGADYTEFFDSGWPAPNIVVSTPPTLVDVDYDGRVELLANCSQDEDGDRGLLVVPFDATGAIDVSGIHLAWVDWSMHDMRVFGDVDGDGRPELAIAHTVEGPELGTSIYPLPGIATDYDDAIVSFSLADVPRLVSSQTNGVGDLNGDGMADLVVNYTADGDGPEPYFLLYPGGL